LKDELARENYPEREVASKNSLIKSVVVESWVSKNIDRE